MIIMTIYKPNDDSKDDNNNDEGSGYDNDDGRYDDDIRNNIDYHPKDDNE